MTDTTPETFFASSKEEQDRIRAVYEEYGMNFNHSFLLRETPTTVSFGMLIVDDDGKFYPDSDNPAQEILTFPKDEVDA